LPIFTELTNVQQHYVQTSNTHFRPNGTINVESINRNLFTPYVKYGFSCDDFRPNGTISVESITINLFKPYVKYGFSCDDFHEIRNRLNLRE
jgi:hypothetical protein